MWKRGLARFFNTKTHTKHTYPVRRKRRLKHKHEVLQQPGPGLVDTPRELGHGPAVAQASCPPPCTTPCRTAESDMLLLAAWMQTPVYTQSCVTRLVVQYVDSRQCRTQSVHVCDVLVDAMYKFQEDQLSFATAMLAAANSKTVAVSLQLKHSLLTSDPFLSSSKSARDALLSLNKLPLGTLVRTLHHKSSVPQAMTSSWCCAAACRPGACASSSTAEIWKNTASLTGLKSICTCQD